MSSIYHITTRAEWEKALISGAYRAPSLDTEGFIHCSTAEQVVRVANAFYAGQRGLVLLCIDPARLAADLRYEPPVHEASDDLFPHVYGPINLDAVVKVAAFEPGADGMFIFPSEAAAPS